MPPALSIVVATHNVLADPYISPEFYPRCDPEDFRPENRHPRLLAYEAALGADVILQQEVTHEMFVKLDATLRPRGYVGRWAHKWAGKPDGCATFVRAPFRVATSMIVDLDDGGGKPNGHVALATVLVFGGAMLTVVNAHIKWDRPDAPPGARPGLAQAEHLLQVLANQPHTVIGMDLNAEPGSAAHAAFEDAGFVDAHPATHTTFILDGRPRKIDYLLHTRDLRARPLPSPVATTESVLPSKSEPSDHVPLLAAFAAAG